MGRLVFGHRQLAFPQSFLLFFEKRIGALARLMRIHTQVEAPCTEVSRGMNALSARIAAQMGVYQ
jgi:hypothetical protein